MGNISLDGIQKILKLDVEYPYFQTYEESIEFAVDGVTVKAIATIRWRYITLDIIEPFCIRAWTFDPPFFGLGIMMLNRRDALLKNGMTDRDDFLEKAKTAYIRHVTYLQLKPQIDLAQAPILNKHSAELQRLKLIYDSVRDRVAIGKSELRRQFKSNLVTQKQYQTELKVLNNQEFEAEYGHSNLEREIEINLGAMKQKMIDAALDNNSKGA